MNDMVKFAGNTLPASADELVEGLKNVAAGLQGGTGGMLLLRLLKSGTFAYGPESIEPEVASEWAANPNSLQHGWACWGDGELLDERMVPFTQAAPARGDLPDYGHEWGQQVSIILQCLTGEDAGVSVLYKGTSTGLRNAVKELINKLVAQIAKDPKHCVPVMTLEVDSYQHKKYGQIYFPVFELLRWVTFQGAANTAPDVDDETVAEKASADAAAGTPRRRRGAPTAEEDTPAPRRRRRPSR